MNEQFSIFIHNFVKQYKTDIFSNIPKCKSLLLDHAKGEYKNEIRLLLQSLELDCYATIMNSNDLNITRMALIKQLQEEYYISDNIATSLIDLLLVELRNYKIEQKEQITKTKSKKNISNQQNVPSRNKSTRLQTSMTNKTNIDTSAIQEISSIITIKKQKEISSLNIFKDKIKTIYEPTFKKYKRILDDNNLECSYKISEYTTSVYIVFDFLFVKSLIPISSHPPQYSISYDVKQDIISTGIFYAANFYLPDTTYQSNNKNFFKHYDIENLTTEVIMNDLSMITEKILQKIKEKQNKGKEQTSNQNSKSLQSQTISNHVLIKPKRALNKKNNSTDVLKGLFSYIDDLLDYAPEEETKKFAFSENYATYIKIFKENENVYSGQKEKMKDLFTHIDELLSYLPDDKIEEFAKSGHYETYKKLFLDLGII